MASEVGAELQEVAVALPGPFPQQLGAGQKWHAARQTSAELFSLPALCSAPAFPAWPPAVPKVLGMGLSASGVLQLSLGVFISLAVQGNAGGAVLLGGPSSRAGSDPSLSLS